MDIVITLFYLLFCICVVYPPTEFVSAGFTIADLFDETLGSENLNFVDYHMKRIITTIVVHSFLPMGYLICLWASSGDFLFYLPYISLSSLLPLAFAYKAIGWIGGNCSNHPVAKNLQLSATEGSDWRVVAASLNVEFRSVDKVSIPLTATSKFVATATWLVKVTQYSLQVVKQDQCALVATATDVHNLTTSGEDEVQYVNVEVIPARNNITKFSFRIDSLALGELQPRLQNPVRVPDHLTLQPTLIERFVVVFRQHVEQNPVQYVEEELEYCIGCMQARADVKLHRRCQPAPAIEGEEPPPTPCRTCHCRVLWCCSCMGRWWASRATGPPATWLGSRCTCPVCRAPFCLLDVCPARPA